MTTEQEEKMRKRVATKDTVDRVPMMTEQEEKMRKRVATKDTVDLFQWRRTQHKKSNQGRRNSDESF